MDTGLTLGPEAEGKVTTAGDDGIVTPGLGIRTGLGILTTLFRGLGTGSGMLGTLLTGLGSLGDKVTGPGLTG